MKKFDMTKLTRTFYKAKLQLKKHSPEILVVGGVVGTVASTVIACKATTKIDSILEETKNKVELVHQTANEKTITVDDVTEPVDYSKEDKVKDLTLIYVQTAGKMIKLYSPAIILGTISITSILGGYNIIRKRNLALATAYAAVDKSFKEYRNRVVNRFGKDVDYELRHNVKTTEVEEIIKDEKTGEEKTVKTTIEVPNPDKPSLYARFFDETSRAWTKDPEANMFFLRSVENWANKRLQTVGYLFLNEVYEAIGLDKTVAGNVVGWVYDEKNGNGDTYVDFGIYNQDSTASRRFVNGYERSILLDFNCDGDILHSGILEQ